MSRDTALVNADWVEEHLDDPTSSWSRSTRTPRPTTRATSAAPSSSTGPRTCRTRSAATSSNKQQFEELLSEQGRRQRPHGRAVRRQQQLVRRLRLLVLQALRPPGRQAPRRRPQEVGARQPRADRRDHRRREKTSYTAQEQDTSIRAFRDETVEAIGVKNLVDVRSPDEYAGRLLAPAHLPQEQAQRAGSHPDRGERAVEQGGQRRRHLPLATTSSSSSTPRPASTGTRTPSPTAASVSAPATPGSCCTSCSASRTSRTTTAPGPSTARSSASRSRSATSGVRPDVRRDQGRPLAGRRQRRQGVGDPGRRHARRPAGAATPTSGCSTGPASSPPRCRRRRPGTSGSSRPPASGRCAPWRPRPRPSTTSVVAQQGVVAEVAVAI